MDPNQELEYLPPGSLHHHHWFAILHRFITGMQSDNVDTKAEEGSQAPSIPYWIPGFGHLFAFLWDPIGFLTECK